MPVSDEDTDQEKDKLELNAVWKKRMAKFILIILLTCQFVAEIMCKSTVYE